MKLVTQRIHIKIIDHDQRYHINMSERPESNINNCYFL